ncbi:MAG: GNAT family N-acetyltransferase [Chitinophagales bacterium]|jgi:RimJ/RimL family protein N-acetyltransferase|nr:GNAT family N-acetyltransferase [Chitinophagales bacterium]HNI45190.1 GNAT family N-acetyltransferase [Chitinophagales bacterium]
MIAINDTFELVALRWKDRATLVKYLNDPEYHRTTGGIPYPYTLDSATWFYNYVHEFELEHGFVREFSICHRPTDEIIGGIGLVNNAILTPQDSQVEIGYWLARPYWGQGIMTTILRFFVQYVFQKWQIPRLYAYTMVWNHRSQQVLLRCGFVYDPQLRKTVIRNNESQDLIGFYITPTTPTPDHS